MAATQQRRPMAQLLALVAAALMCRTALAQVRLHQLQMLHAHNSYHLCPLPNMVKGFDNSLIKSFTERSDMGPDSLAYGYPSLLELVRDYGVRSLELDVFYDPDGGRYGYRLGPKVVELLGLYDDSFWQVAGPDLFYPGFKVMHVPDVDFQSSCESLSACLKPLWQWSSSNTNHTPLMITIQYETWDPESMLSSAVKLGLKALLLFDRSQPTWFASSPDVDVSHVAALEQEVLSVWNRSNIYTPDDFRAGYAHLQERITQIGWPAVEGLKGRTIFRVFGDPTFIQFYEQQRPGGQGALLFVEDSVTSLPYIPSNSTVFASTDISLARIFNGTALQQVGLTGALNVGGFSDEQKRVLTEQYRLGILAVTGPGRVFLRASADEGTVQAREDFAGFANAVMAGGAQLVHTDYPNGWKGACGPTGTSYTARVQQLQRGTWDPLTLTSTTGTSTTTTSAADGTTTVSTTSSVGPSEVLVSACNVITAPPSCTTWNNTAGFKLPASCTCYATL